MWGTVGGMHGIGAIGSYAARVPIAVSPSVLAGGVLGFLVGRALDRRLILVEIVDPAGP